MKCSRRCLANEAPTDTDRRMRGNSEATIDASGDGTHCRVLSSAQKGRFWAHVGAAGEQLEVLLAEAAPASETETYVVLFRPSVPSCNGWNLARAFSFTLVAPSY